MPPAERTRPEATATASDEEDGGKDDEEEEEEDDEEEEDEEDEEEKDGAKVAGADGHGSCGGTAGSGGGAR